jgi:hypothetical protein
VIAVTMRRIRSYILVDAGPLVGENLSLAHVRESSSRGV